MAKLNTAMHDLLKYNSALLPKNRSGFNRSHSKTTTFNSGYLIPIFIDDILPGDELKLSIDALVRMSTPKFPTMDTAYVDFFAFFCPDRIVWDNAKAFFGENLDAEYNALGEYKRPTFTYTNQDWYPQSLLDYMEFPYLGDPIIEVLQSEPLSVLDFRKYQKIWNDWFRASEVQPSVFENTGDTVTDSEKAVVFELRKVNKLHDYFTSLLPKPQGGESVSLPLGDWAPVQTRIQDAYGNDNGEGIRYSDDEPPFKAYSINSDPSILNLPEYFNYDPIDRKLYLSDISYDNAILPSNLWANLADATSATINNLRAAITVQQALEIDSLGGSRYSSLIRAHFGVVCPDDVLQRPQLLGTHRQVVGMRTVAQTSANSGDQVLGDVGAFSATRVAGEYLVNKSFTEWGTLMVLCCVRPLHTYSQGYPERALKLSRFDIYHPVFDRLGNQPVYTKTLVALDRSSNDIVASDRVLGYKNAWDEYRIAQNKVTGYMRPDIEESLSSWNYADLYEEAPILNSDFLEEDQRLIDRTLAISSEDNSSAPQFIGDFYFKIEHYRPMSVSSIPGLLRF